MQVHISFMSCFELGINAWRAQVQDDTGGHDFTFRKGKVVSRYF